MCRRSRSRLTGPGLLTLLLASGALAQTAGPRPSPQEEARRKLLEQMGLDKTQSPPPKPPQPSPAEPAPAAPAAPPPPGATAAPAAPPVVPFSGRVHESLLGSCRTCHAAGAMAAASRFLLTGNAGADHASARKLVDLGSPRRSLLLTKGTGVQHGGGPTLAAGSDSYRRLLAWISTGAELNVRTAPTAAAATGAVAVAATPAPRAPRPRPGSSPSLAAPPLPLPLPPGPAVPAAPASGPATTVAASEPPVSAAGAADPASAPSAPHPTALAVHASMRTACLACHRAGGPAAMTRYKLTGTFAADIAASRVFVDPTGPAASPLLTKAAGQVHGGGAPWPPGSDGQRALLAWIEAGAPEVIASPAAADPATATAAPIAPLAPAPAVAPAPTPSSPPAPQSGAAHAHAGGIPLFGDALTLNGRFDLNLERRSFDANPWGDGSQTALVSHHHFLFLSRQSAEDPFTFTAELVSLEFYEVGLRLGPRKGPARLHLRAGKLLVPFGTEPLFHQSYGGHQGFDQRVLPAIWTAEGLAASGHLETGPVTLSADLYGVRGHALRRADAVLSLQSDFSTTDDARPAAGLRLGAAAGALGGFYSAYFNPLGHDRRLLMQALDVGLWRWRRYPGLDRLVLAAGLLRADVSGAGSPGDYYHFASYWLARVYPLHWLHLQYRQGLRTFDNKRNLTYDRRRAGPEDGSTHNLAIGTRYRGLSVGLSYYLNFEKAAEVDDDLLRLAVAYEF